VLATAESGAAGPQRRSNPDERLGGEECNPPGAESFRIVRLPRWILRHETGGEGPRRDAVRSLPQLSCKTGPQQDGGGAWATCPSMATVRRRAQGRGGQIKTLISPTGKRLALAQQSHKRLDQHGEPTRAGCSRSFQPTGHASAFT